MKKATHLLGGTVASSRFLPMFEANYLLAAESVDSIADFFWQGAVFSLS
ncbi:MAG: hypothetical protein WC657_07180 [Candidatus Paceibacterota bacterium]|jgi:hypothetical protein|nr:hypothetical protein [Prolixibacteraceae bacterium]